MFQLDDYQLLDRLLERFDKLVTTPHVLTEVSNHAHHLKGPLGVSLLERFAQFSASTLENHRSAVELSRRPEFISLGIADCALTELGTGITVITTDFRLSGILEAKGHPVLNLNKLRQERLFRD